MGVSEDITDRVASFVVVPRLDDGEGDIFAERDIFVEGELIVVKLSIG